MQKKQVQDIILTMLFEIFENLKNNRILCYLREFFSSIWYMIFVGVLVTLSNLFGLELFTYWAFVFIAILATLFAESTVSYVPMMAMGYMTVSNNGNPGLSNESVFYQPYFKGNIISIGVIIGILLIVRFYFEVYVNKDTKKQKKNIPQLTYGFIALGIVYLLGGLFSHKFDISTGEYLQGTSYSIRTVLFGALEIFCLAFIYFYLYFTVDRSDLDLNYFTKLLIVMGFVIAVQTLGMYIDVIKVNGIKGFNRGQLVIGWGCYNNIGGMMALTVAAPLYYVAKNKKPLIFTFISLFFMVVVIFIQSRGSIFGALVVLLMGLVISAIKGNRLTKIRILESIFICCCVQLILMLAFKEYFMNLFNSLAQSGLNSSGRFSIYKDALRQFIANPFFGNGFYECKGFVYGELLKDSFLPPRYHNTICQMLACCGIVGLVAYIYHRYQTVKLTVVNNNLQGLFIGLSIFVLLITSLLDNHFFNFGPGLVYSIALFFQEANKEKVLEERGKSNKCILSFNN